MREGCCHTQFPLVFFPCHPYAYYALPLAYAYSNISSLNACKNILVVVHVMDRPLCETVLCTLYPEWGNPRCCVPVLRALQVIVYSDPPKTIRTGFRAVQQL